MHFVRKPVPVADTSRQQVEAPSFEQIRHKLVQVKKLLHTATGSQLQRLKEESERLRKQLIVQKRVG